MKEFKGCKNYTLLNTEELKDSKSIAYTLRHDKTGARVVLIGNDDDNKAFIIGFKTPQKDSTGVPHILEHSVLCGSEKYPVKDAMTEVSKGSLNTFLNAFTYPDRTLYPVASCNDKDFQNLMSVYLDAVFHPRVHEEKRIFMQEGWHYEMKNLRSPITLNGVVYNEMKGVYSSPESALSSYILFSLFPDTQYGVESGGDPDVIPDLTYEDFCAFHKKLYHPSNSRIFLYGDMDFEEKLTFIDEEYLSKYNAIKPDSEIKLQKPFKAPVRVVKEYAISEGQDTKNATFLSYNVVCSDYTDVKTTEVMNAINYALCSVPGAKLKERLIDAGIGKDVYSDFVVDTCQKVFSIVAQDANPEDEERFVKIVEDTIKEIIEEGFDRKTLEASITSSEFSYRESDFGYYPKGIAFGTMTFDEWLYSDDNIFSALKQNEIFKELREGIDEGLFEKVLKERVLENNHKTILIMKPNKGLDKKKEKELALKLANLKASLSKEELKEIVRSTKDLKAYQEAEDSLEALATIPTLSIKDIKKEFKKCVYSIEEVDGIKEIYVDTNTNGIAYFTLAFNAEKLPERLIPALSVLKTLLTYVDTKSYKYGDLVNEINIKTGNLNFCTSVYRNIEDTNKYKFNFEIRCKALYRSLTDAFNLINEVLFSSKLEDKKRVKENLEQSKVRILGIMMQSGHSVAIGNCAKTMSDSFAISEMLSGMGQFRYIERILSDFDNCFDKLVKDMKEVLELLITKDNLEVSIGCGRRHKEKFDEELSKFVTGLKEKTKLSKVVHIKANGVNEAFSSSSQVQYVAQCGNYKMKNPKLEYTGSLQVLKSILNTDYLWTAVRLKGGAYGCFGVIMASGDCAFVSYRDPGLKSTLEAYEDAVKYIENYSGSKEDVDRFIISTIGDNDTPLTPSMKVARAYSFYKSEITNEFKQKERDEILNTKPETIKELSKYIEAMLDCNKYSCVGGNAILKKEGEMFEKITPLSKG